MSRYVLTPKAREDLDAIWRYSAERWEPDQADRYLRRIGQAFAGLAEGTARGRSAQDVRPGYFRLIVASHVIYYRNGTDGCVEIVRILHGRMDVERHL